MGAAPNLVRTDLKKRAYEPRGMSDESSMFGPSTQFNGISSECCVRATFHCRNKGKGGALILHESEYNRSVECFGSRTPA